MEHPKIGVSANVTEGGTGLIELYESSKLLESTMKPIKLEVAVCLECGHVEHYLTPERLRIFKDELEVIKKKLETKKLKRQLNVQEGQSNILKYSNIM